MVQLPAEGPQMNPDGRIITDQKKQGKIPVVKPRGMPSAGILPFAKFIILSDLW
jgi:hypothetical protein